MVPGPAMVRRELVIQFTLPRPLDDSVLIETLRRNPRAPVVISLPESWCYRISRGAPPGGWKRNLLLRLRPGLFPEPMEAIAWDEDLSLDGTWQVWAISNLRLNRALGTLASHLWNPGRRVRIRPGKNGGEGLAAFPNLAPKRHRAYRVPWQRIRRVALFLGPTGVIVAALLLGGLYVRGKWVRLREDLALEAKIVQSQERELTLERQYLSLLQQQTTKKSQDAPWLTDLDALTRLLPEDTRLVSLEWSPQQSRLDVITPHPERIQEILEASPEFRGVRFLGNLDRQGEQSRLTLQVESEAVR